MFPYFFILRFYLKYLNNNSMAISCFFELSLFLFFLSFLTVVSSETLPGCASKCGNVNIPYPFGIGSNCAMGAWSNLYCNTTFNPPKPFLYGNLEVLKLSMSEVRIKTGLFVATACYNQSGGLLEQDMFTFNFTNKPYTLSSTKNRVKAIGCDTFLHTKLNSNNFNSGCQSSCQNIDDVDLDSCSGSGCCQTPIPRGLKEIFYAVDSIGHHKNVWSFNPCGAAFIGEEGMYKLKKSDLSNTTTLKDIPTVLNFAIGDQNCREAKTNATTYACKENSYCYEYVDGTGYLCSCNPGYDGNPYLQQSCQDVNECEDPNKNPCEGICTNTQGSYQCSCLNGSYGDGTKNGTRCTVKDKKFPILPLTLGLGLGCLFSLGMGCWLYLSIKKRKLSKLKEKFFQQNGGLLLKKHVSSHEGSSKSTKIFTSEELKLATNNYDDRRILGEGGFGTVYKGVLPDLRIVAIKKSKIIDESQLGQFINEIVILTQINHRNVVKLIGLCLETEVPLLVYEFVSNGTLSHHLHKKNGVLSAVSWADRLRIASETAGAIAYLHSAASTPIIHRDIKSANILLDNNYTAKVADFGASRLNPLDESQITTMVQGTLGYLDPEYFHTGQLTDKSDVFSFGVLLAELLTGEKPLCFERSENQRNLATYFIISIKENRLFELLDAVIVNDGNILNEVNAVADVARRCLNSTSEQRPSMKQVVAELEGLRGFGKHSSGKRSNEESMSLTKEHEADLYAIPSSAYSTDGVSELALYGSEGGITRSLNVPR